MRFCGAFRVAQELGGPEKGLQAHPFFGERILPTLLAVDDADRRADLKPGLPERLHGLDRCARRGHDVLDEAHALAHFEGAFEPVRGAVALRVLADDQERSARCERGRSRESNGAELGPGEAGRLRLVLANGRGDQVTERPEQLGPSLEAVLVEVVPRAPARAQQEVALEVCVLAERRAELVAVH